jgi:hypothetical protein
LTGEKSFLCWLHWFNWLDLIQRSAPFYGLTGQQANQLNYKAVNGQQGSKVNIS